jgi:type III secretory pathway component EscV
MKGGHTMTTLNTDKYIQAHDNLGRFRYPLSYDNRLAYVSLSAILAECINQKLGINQTQKMLDAMTQNEINLLERLSK